MEPKTFDPPTRRWPCVDRDVEVVAELSLARIGPQLLANLPSPDPGDPDFNERMGFPPGYHAPPMARQAPRGLLSVDDPRALRGERVHIPRGFIHALRGSEGGPASRPI